MTSSLPVLAVFVGALVGAGVFLLIIALRGLPVKPAAASGGRLARLRADFGGRQGLIALLAAAAILVVTRWVVAAAGVALLILFWRKLSGGARGERLAIERLEGLAVWTESLRDTIAGAVGLEQAIPSSARVATPALSGPLTTMIDRLHTRVPLPDALHRFADDIADPSADLIIAALIINARLRGPGLRDLLAALSSTVREELDMRRRIEAQRRATRFSAMFVVAFSVGVAALLAFFNRHFVQVYDTLNGQLILLVIAGLYAGGFYWLAQLAKFDVAERILVSRTALPADGLLEPAGTRPGGAS